MSGKPKIIVRIDEGELPLGQPYPAKRIAVSNPAI
jgi:hypothetical protein